MLLLHLFMLICIASECLSQHLSVVVSSLLDSDASVIGWAPMLLTNQSLSHRIFYSTSYRTGWMTAPKLC